MLTSACVSKFTITISLQKKIHFSFIFNLKTIQKFSTWFFSDLWYTVYAEIFVVLKFLWVPSTTKIKPTKILPPRIIRALSPPIVPRCCHMCAKKWEYRSLTLYATCQWTTWPPRLVLFDSTIVIHCGSEPPCARSHEGSGQAEAWTASL